MKKILLSLLFIASILSLGSAKAQLRRGSHSIKTEEIPSRLEILETMQLANKWFMDKYQDPTKPTFVNKERSSNLWTRSVYYEGLMALYSICPKQEYYDYTLTWCDFHKWTPRNGAAITNADDYCCSQTYIDMYRLCPEPYKLTNTIALLNSYCNKPDLSDWWWIDAIQMAMPVFAKLGNTLGEEKYWDKMYDMYLYTRNTFDGGLWNERDGLWWRDYDFNPPYRTPHNRQCYWSRGNGWVVAALVRTLEELPENHPYYETYKNDLIHMCRSLAMRVRNDGTWNCSLDDPKDFGGMEISGTSLFVYGMAWCVRHRYLNPDTFIPIIAKAWNTMVKEAVHSDGFLGFVQGTGKEPKDSQPTTYDKAPDFEDFGLGCFLLCGSEVYKLSRGEQGVGAQRLKKNK